MKKTELKVYVLIYAFGWNSFWAQMILSCYIYVLEINLVHTKSKLGYQGKKEFESSQTSPAAENTRPA